MAVKKPVWGSLNASRCFNNMSNPEYFKLRNILPVCMADQLADEIHQLIARVTMLEDFSLSEINSLGRYMPVYQAEVGGQIITEGEDGDFMVILLSGSVDVTKKDQEGHPSRIAVVEAGHALGEMSMMDGEPRFSSCIALESTKFAVLTRESLTQVIKAEPYLGAKIMLKLVHMLSQRLRNTSRQLVKIMETSRQARA